MPMDVFYIADPDSNFTANSNKRVPSQKAVKSAIDALWSALSGGIKLIWEEQLFVTPYQSTQYNITLDSSVSGLSELMVFVNGKTLVPSECLSLNTEGTVLTIENDEQMPIGLKFIIKRAKIEFNM